MARTGITAAIATVTATATPSQPYRSASTARRGKKISCPAALAALSRPIARPLLATNQRLATAAAIPTAPAPAPIPTITPQVRNNCHGEDMSSDKPVPAAKRVMHPRIVRFSPITCTRPIKNGPVKPIRMMLIDTAAEIVPTLQPKARSSGRIMTPGAARTPTPASVAKNITTSTTQA